MCVCVPEELYRKDSMLNDRTKTFNIPERERGIKEQSKCNYCVYNIEQGRGREKGPQNNPPTNYRGEIHSAWGIWNLAITVYKFVELVATDGPPHTSLSLWNAVLTLLSHERGPTTDF